jgi:chromosomal replication initiation ATPase DnaA
MNAWDQILEKMRTQLPEEDFRRWFGATSYASDSGDQLTVWVLTEAIRQHIATHYQYDIEQELAESGRAFTRLRLVVSGLGDDEEDEEE